MKYTRSAAPLNGTEPTRIACDERVPQPFSYSFTHQGSVIKSVVRMRKYNRRSQALHLHPRNFCAEIARSLSIRQELALIRAFLPGPVAVSC